MKVLHNKNYFGADLKFKVCLMFLIYESNNYCLPDSEMVSCIVASSSLPLLSSGHKLTSNVCEATRKWNM